jgi:hypothetical protein
MYPSQTKTTPTHFQNHLGNGYAILHVLYPVTDVFYETSGNSGFDPLADKQIWILILVDVLKIEAI